MDHELRLDGRVAGRLDIVVNNAGIADRHRPFTETSLELFERLWRGHLGGQYNVIRAAWPFLAEQRYGRVIMTGSSAGFFGTSQGSIAYASAKGAVAGLTFALAHASLEDGIRVNGVTLGGYAHGGRHVPGRGDRRTVARVFAPELVFPIVVWLARESCDVNGHFYEAYGGHFARVLTGEPEGHWDLHPTPESDSRGPRNLRFPTDDTAESSWVVSNALERAAAPARGGEGRGSRPGRASDDAEGSAGRAAGLAPGP